MKDPRAGFGGFVIALHNKNNYFITFKDLPYFVQFLKFFIYRILTENTADSYEFLIISLYSLKESFLPSFPL
jgi:hypothetical protein